MGNQGFDSRNVQTGSSVQPTSRSTGIRGFLLGYSGRDVQLTTHHTHCLGYQCAQLCICAQYMVHGANGGGGGGLCLFKYKVENFTVSPRISIHYLYLFQLMHIFNTTLIQCQFIKTLKNHSYMFRSLNDHPQGAIWSLLKLLS
jgi:hypothetical protein